jgi:hypothetical protein
MAELVQSVALVVLSLAVVLLARRVRKLERKP